MDIVKYSRYTNTTKFIIPLLFDKNTKYHELFQNFFINAYIADIANKENDDNIHLVFADYPSIKLQQTLPDTISEYRRGDGFILVYPLALDWLDDYEKLIMGEYSQISEVAKQRILSFWDEDDTSIIWGILYKQGNSVQKYLQDVLGLKHVDLTTKEKEWWLDYKITEEMLGLGN